MKQFKALIAVLILWSVVVLLSYHYFAEASTPFTVISAALVKS